VLKVCFTILFSIILFSFEKNLLALDLQDMQRPPVTRFEDLSNDDLFYIFQQGDLLNLGQTNRRMYSLYRSKIKTLNLYLKTISDDMFHDLFDDGKAYHNVSHLNLSRAELSPQLFNELPRTLIWLNLNESQIGPQEATALGRLDRLRYLNLRHNKIGLEGIEAISKLKTLEYLKLDSNLAEGHSFEELLELKNLKFLTWAYNDFTDRDLRDIHELKNLKKLGLSGNHITGKVFRKIARLPELESLDLSGNQIDCNYLRDLSRLKKLTYLDLGYSKTSLQCIQEISRIKHLQHLKLDTEALEKKPNYYRSSFSDESLDMNAVRELKKLRFLKTLKIRRCGKTEKIQKELPTVKVTGYG
jgi:Leucine-rich repeat (LRR) protein